MTDSLSPVEHTGIGAIAGSMEVLLMQPTIAIKNALQEGRPVPWSPSALYRGLGVRNTLLRPLCIRNTSCIVTACDMCTTCCR